MVGTVRGASATTTATLVIPLLESVTTARMTPRVIIVIVARMDFTGSRQENQIPALPVHVMAGLRPAPQTRTGALGGVYIARRGTKEGTVNCARTVITGTLLREYLVRSASAAATSTLPSLETVTTSPESVTIVYTTLPVSIVTSASVVTTVTPHDSNVNSAGAISSVPRTTSVILPQVIVLVRTMLWVELVTSVILKPTGYLLGQGVLLARVTQQEHSLGPTSATRAQDSARAGLTDSTGPVMAV